MLSPVIINREEVRCLVRTGFRHGLAGPASSPSRARHYRCLLQQSWTFSDRVPEPSIETRHPSILTRRTTWFVPGWHVIIELLSECRSGSAIESRQEHARTLLVGGELRITGHGLILST